MREELADIADTPDIEAFEETGPGTVAGSYLRRFWQPVYHVSDLEPGRAAPLQVLGERFTLYRGESGAFHLVEPRCPHRGTLLSTGNVEGDCLRCFYHGWKFDSDGACVEQPAEDSSFAHKVRIRSYPTRSYLGLVFAWLGDGEAPDFPTYPEFDHFDGLIELDSYRRDCNYFQNLENALDMSHVAFVHGDNQAAFREIGAGRRLSAEESDWGVTYTFRRDDGQLRIQQFGMPNIFYMNALPIDPDIGWQESLFWWVPINDEQHIQFSVHRVPAEGAARQRIHERRQARRERLRESHQTICEEILAGRMRLQDVDTDHVDLVRLQDDIAQVGQGRIANRAAERLGRGDVGVIAIRKLWRRELSAMQEGRALTSWRRDGSIVPKTWGLGGEAPRFGGVTEGAEPEVVDVRPFVEIAQQLEPHRA